MGQQTGIAWTDSTFNPWIGCRKVSPACTNCYAEVSTTSNVSRKTGLELWGTENSGAVRRITSDGNWALPLRWNQKASMQRRPIKVFCASLADVFEEWNGPLVNQRGEVLYEEPGVRSMWFTQAREGRIPLTLDTVRRKLFALIERTPWLIWMLLTKRPENIRRMATPELLRASNVWLGCTVENQENADLRIPRLVANTEPGSLRWLSVEPMLGQINLLNSIRGLGPMDIASVINWVIVGGESDNGGQCTVPARKMLLEWARGMRDQCEYYGIPYFFKQWGAWCPLSQLDAGTDLTGVEMADEVIGLQHYAKVGKDVAGDRLDGQNHYAFPEVRGV